MKIKDSDSDQWFLHFCLFPFRISLKFWSPLLEKCIFYLYTRVYIYISVCVCMYIYFVCVWRLESTDGAFKLIHNYHGGSWVTDVVRDKGLNCFKQKTVSAYWMEKGYNGYKTVKRENTMKTIETIQIKKKRYKCKLCGILELSLLTAQKN